MRGAWRVIVALVGGTLVAVGIALLVLPGPGLLVVLAGLAVLATEFSSARRRLTAIRRRLAQARQRLGR